MNSPGQESARQKLSSESIPTLSRFFRSFEALIGHRSEITRAYQANGDCPRYDSRKPVNPEWRQATIPIASASCVPIFFVHRIGLGYNERYGNCWLEQDIRWLDTAWTRQQHYKLVIKGAVKTGAGQ